MYISSSHVAFFSFHILKFMFRCENSQSHVNIFYSYVKLRHFLRVLKTKKPQVPGCVSYDLIGLKTYFSESYSYRKSSQCPIGQGNKT